MGIARCMKCKKDVEVKDEKIVLNKRQMYMRTGVCPDCDTKVCRIIGKTKPVDDDEEDLE